jgi:hypothetical protein
VRKIIFLLFFFTASLLLTDCKTIRGLATLSTVNFSEKNFKTVIPFETRSDLIRIKVGLNGSADKYNFVFDTGAGGSVISKKLADSLHLEVKGEISVNDALGNNSKLQVVRIRELDINGIKYFDLGAVVSNFEQNPALKCIAGDGIIGVNIITNCNWIVDYQKKTITATDSALTFPAAYTSLPFKGFVPRINLKIGSTEFKNVMVDLGSNESITIPNRELQKHPGFKISDIAYRKVDGSTQGLNGARQDTVMVYYSDSVKIGNRNLQHTNITTAKNSILKVGENVWNKQLFALDYKNKKIYMGPLADTSHKQFLKGFGLRISMKNEKQVVTALFDNSPASDAGIKIGDEITEINGKPISSAFDSYCDELYYMSTVMDKQPEITLKIKGRTGDILLKNGNYRPVKK